MEGIRTGPYLTLCWSCASQNWLSYGAVGEMSRKQLIANTCLFYNFNNPILLPPQLSAADSAEDMMRLAAEDENLSFDTPFSRIAQLQEDMAHLSSDYEDRIANLESQIEAEKLKSTIMLRKISSCIALKSSASSTSAPHSFANNNHNNSPLEDLSMSRDSIETTQFEAMIDESDSRQEMLQVLSQINQLRTQAFFSMGLAYKLSTGISLNLHDLWDRVETENIPIEVSVCVCVNADEGL